MSTTLEITCGGTSKVLAITHSICRIGSLADLELCMPGIEGHAATLRIQNGKRLIYNRSAKPIKLNGKLVQPEQTMEWATNQLLELADGISLRLLSPRAECQVKASEPGVLASQTPVKFAANDPKALSTQREKQRRATIAAFLLVFATILFSSDTPTSDPEMDEALASVISDLALAERDANGGRYQQLRVELQNAMLRSDLKAASIHRIKQILGTHTSQASAAIDERILKIVEAGF